MVPFSLFVLLHLGFVPLLNRVVPFEGSRQVEKSVRYADIEARIADWKRRYPRLFHVESLGKTVEGRDIPIVRLSDDATPNEKEPGVLFVGGIHPRESQPMRSLLWMMDELLSGYGRDARITRLFKTRQIYVVPVLNVDGKVFDETAPDPAPGYDWRKNRRVLADGTIGVDLNRNFAVRWGGFRDLDTTWRDRTTNTRGNIYEGAAPVSEPETLALSRFVEQHQRHLRLFVDVHSPLRKVLCPTYVWGTDAVRYQGLLDGVRARQSGKPYAATVIQANKEPKPGARPGNTGLSYTQAYYESGVFGLNIEIGASGDADATESVDGDADLLAKHYPPASDVRAEYEARIRQPFFFLLDACANLPRTATGIVRVIRTATDKPATPGATVAWTPTLSGAATYAVLTSESPGVVVQSELRGVPVASGFTITIAPDAKPGTVMLDLAVWDNQRHVSHCRVPFVIAPK